MSTAPPAGARAAATPDLLTVAALAVLAGALATVLHEGLGHGGACVLSGGHNLVISSVNEDCTAANPWIDAAGTLVNLAAGAAGFFWSRRVRAPRLRFFLWLSAAFNLLAAAGYWLFSGIGGLGDWGAILAGHQPAWLWRTGMAVIGGVMYVLFVRLLIWELKPFLPCDISRVARARRMLLTAYLTYGVLNCIAGIFNPVGAVLIAESAAAASFGGASGLAWGWQWTASRHFAQSGPALPPLTRSRGWILAAAAAAVAFIAVLGPGIRP